MSQDADRVAAFMAATEETPSRRLSPKKTSRIYKLGGLLKLGRAKLEARVSQLENNKEADEAIAILEEELAKLEAEQVTTNQGKG